MAKAMHRVAVVYDGVPRELLAVREAKDFGLLITPQPEDNWLGSPAGQAAPVKTQHFSVHPATREGATGTLFTRTTVLTDGTEAKAYKYVAQSAHSLFSHLYTKCFPRLTDKYNLPCRERDVVHEIGKFSFRDQTTMVLSVVVADPAKEFPKVGGTSLHTLRFHKYQLGLYSSYLNVPADRDGSMIFFATAPERVNGVIQEGRRHEDHLSIEPGHLSDFILESMKRTAASVMTTRATLLPEDAAHRLLSTPLWFHRHIVDLAVGRVERRAGLQRPPND